MYKQKRGLWLDAKYGIPRLQGHKLHNFNSFVINITKYIQIFDKKKKKSALQRLMWFPIGIELFKLVFDMKSNSNVLKS